MKGVTYVNKQCNGAATSSTDGEEEEEDATSVVVELDEDEENKLENPPQSPKMKATGSAIKKKREVVSFLHLCVMSDSSFRDNTDMLLFCVLWQCVCFC